MRIGSADALKVYLNGLEIHRREGPKGDGYMWNRADVTGVRLTAGRNVLVLKVVNLEADWRTSVWLTDAAGETLKGIRVTLEPSEQQ